MASFAELKARRAAQQPTAATPTGTASSTATASSPQEQVEPLSPNDLVNEAGSLDMYSLDQTTLEMRTVPGRGRGLFAKKAIPAGTPLMKIAPHVAILDKQHLPILCSHCKLDKQTGEALRRCSACKAVHYCSEACQRADWKPELHKLECSKLVEFTKSIKAMGRPPNEYIPDTPVRALGRLLLLKSHRNELWWDQVTGMASSPRALTPQEEENLGILALAVNHYLGGPDVIKAMFPQLEPRQITRLLISISDKFGINSFSLTAPDLTNIGVAIAPAGALINHSCYPNCATVFPEGPSKDLYVVAFRSIEAGEEVLASYADLASPYAKRQQDLQEQFKFQCQCDVCEAEKRGQSKRFAVICTKKGCDGHLPLPLPADVTTSAVTLRCPKCKTERSINYDKADSEDLGLRWALDQARDQLALRSPDEFEKLPRNQQLAFEVLVYQLTQIHKMHPASQPLLDINALGVDRALSQGVSLYKDKRYGRAAQFSQQLIAGLDAVMPEGHPVRAVQRIVLGRLLCIGPDGEEVMDDRILFTALRFMQDTVRLVRGAFGSRSLLLKQLSQGVAELERDLEMRRRVRVG